MSENIPIIDMRDDDWINNLQFELFSTGGSSDYRNDRERPYNGQPWTDEGIRGKKQVEGLTLRDLRDCFVCGFLLCCGIDQSELYEKVKKKTWRIQDIYKINSDHIDPIAAWQNMACEIEKMMGIYPNLEGSPTTEDLMQELKPEE